ncbi:uncharacterized protein LOC117115206 [Anneissia japonica]|uniref:uncharacterized protein LOC117115206 n=1 Tax=Anneissia japonica TaxID=1529436 RepID=UPI0014256AD2|nr:uncharacterized protein LOC117115206 [Anneissia japonica]
MSFRQAMHIAKDSPPCIPFIGTFLQDIIASEFDFDETVIDANLIKGENSSTESLTIQPSLGFDAAEELSNSTSNEIDNNLIDNSSIKGNFLYSFASAWRALRPSFTHKTGKIKESDAVIEFQSRTDISSVSRPKPTPITSERRRHIQKLILAYARKLGAEDNEQNAKVNSGSMDEDYIDWKKLFDFVKIQKDNINVTQQPSSCDSSVYSSTEKADNAIRDQVNRTLFLFQSAAVQYGAQSRPTVRKYLLTKSYVSGDELYTQSRLLEEP